MINNEQIALAKNKSIVEYLKSKNIEPINLIGGELVYLSPLRSEKTPSFYVNITKNNFNDFGGTDEMKGDSIRLVQLMEKCSFLEAINRLSETLDNSTGFFSFSGNRFSMPGTSSIEIKRIQRLQNSALIRYVTSRGILLNNAFSYLKEVHYVIDNRPYFAIGFENDNGGFDLRNGLGFKGKTENGITTIDRGTETISVFEGFFDFLSALRYYRKDAPTVTTIVLNTTNNLKLALPKLSESRVINCFLDNDEAGKRSVKRIEALGHRVIDHSSLIYPTYKDFNDFLIQRYNTTLKSDF
ncbi:toprim domain-containing protein [Dyadobacter sp. LHD-138]|uniref:toprim domain-containing protein n=1 Tax=Dyadobacter sp. LHD-138 TaxID=3071413 RepID=UPI0027E139FC|nr:toprim domain-containing protein [Dyadobacter sp. LHD-138]MDQ6482351.1 toprim domain-containing protein [Dyadobacter sp. LHD-138]